MAVKLLHSFLALMFLLFAAVQYNDPDPWLWATIYLMMTAFCVQAARGRYYPKAMWLAGAGFLLYAAILAPGMYEWWRSPDRSLLFDDLAKMQYPYIEEAREFLGLFICLCVLSGYLWLSRQRKPV